MTKRSKNTISSNLDSPNPGRRLQYGRMWEAFGPDEIDEPHRYTRMLMRRLGETHELQRIPYRADWLTGPGIDGVPEDTARVLPRITFWHFPGRDPETQQYTEVLRYGRPPIGWTTRLQQYDTALRLDLADRTDTPHDLDEAEARWTASLVAARLGRTALDMATITCESRGIPLAIMTLDEVVASAVLPVGARVARLARPAMLSQRTALEVMQAAIQQLAEDLR